MTTAANGIPKLYRVSALASGFVRMWRGWQVIVPLIVVNALIQGLLVRSETWVTDDALRTVLALFSAIVALKSFVVISEVALQAANGPVTWVTIFPALRKATWRGMLWGALLLVVIAVGFALCTVPGILMAAVTPFVVIAAVAGERNPLVANFRTITRRFSRWLITAVITGVAIAIGYLGSGFVMFFLRGMLGAFLVWLAAGFVAAWFITAWTLIYRSSLEAKPADSEQS